MKTRLMNKRLRHEMRRKKYLRRCKNLGLDPSKLYVGFMDQGKPCSCGICSHDKYNRAQENRLIEIDVHQDDMG